MIIHVKQSGDRGMTRRSNPEPRQRSELVLQLLRMEAPAARVQVIGGTDGGQPHSKITSLGGR